MQNRQNNAVGLGVYQFVGLPRRSKRARLRFTIAHHSYSQEARVIQHGTISVRKRVAQLAAFVNGTRSLRRKVAWNATGIRELTEKLLQARLIIGDVRANLAVRAIKQGLRRASRSAVARTHQEDRVLAMVGNQAVDVPKQEVHARSCAPVTNQTMLNIGAAKVTRLARFLVHPVLAHQGIGAQINLTHRKIVGATPVLLYSFERRGRDWTIKLFPRCTKNGLRHSSSLRWPALSFRPVACEVRAGAAVLFVRRAGRASRIASRALWPRMGSRDRTAGPSHPAATCLRTGSLRWNGPTSCPIPEYRR